MIRPGGIAVLLGAATVLTACGGGGGGTVQTRAATTTTVAPAAGSGGGSVNVGIICSTPSDAAHALIDAWTAGDRPAAGRCGSPAAVATLFAQSGGGATWTFQGCVGTVCSYSYAGGMAHLSVHGSDAAGWIVAQVRRGR